jgi:hypothetical protein
MRQTDPRTLLAEAEAAQAKLAAKIAVLRRMVEQHDLFAARQIDLAVECERARAHAESDHAEG